MVNYYTTEVDRGTITKDRRTLAGFFRIPDDFLSGKKSAGNLSGHQLAATSRFFFFFFLSQLTATRLGANSRKSLQQACPLFQVPLAPNLFDLRHVGIDACSRDSYDTS